jgi:hypothetical protein
VHSFDFRIQAPYTSLKETNKKTQTKLQSKREICEIQNQQEEQYKVIQNFQVPQKEQYKVIQTFKCYICKKIK